MDFRTVAITTNSYSLDLPSEPNFSEKQTKFFTGRTYSLIVNVENELVKCGIQYNIYWRKAPEDVDTETPIFKIDVETTFKVEELKNFITGDQDMINDDLIGKLYPIAIAHLRGIQTTYLKNTPLEKILILDESIDSTEFEAVDE